MNYNPFKPNGIVHPGMFAGRVEEIETIEQLLFQTKNGNSSSFLVHGERGIGKSSLLMYIEGVARGNIAASDGSKFNFLVVSVSLEQNDDYLKLIQRIAREFEKELNKNEKLKNLLKDVWKFVTNWEILGVRYHKPEHEPDPILMLEELTDKLCTVLQKLDSNVDGMYIFIDEADKPADNPQLGSIIKNLTEKAQRNNVDRLALGVIGISSVIERIKESHESALRILRFVPLGTLNDRDRKIVIELGLEEANRKNTETTEIEDRAMAIIAQFSEGYPHFLQQYAFSAFEADADNLITEKDVLKGIVGENGALHQLGVRYFDNMYFKEIYSEDYRKVLKVMASHEDEYITKKSIIGQTHLRDYTVQNAISALSKKGIILPKPGVRGRYKLSSTSFKAWILAFTSLKESQKEQ